MMARFTADTSIPSTKVASFEKAAFLGALSGMARKFVPQVITSTARKYTPTALSRGLHPLADTVEHGIVNATRSLGSEGAGQTAGRLMKAAPRRAIREGIGGAMVGGVLTGGIGAAMAEDGQRGKAFMSGLVPGAISGGLGGVVSGMAGAMTQNARGMHMSSLAARNNMSRPMMAKRVKDMGFMSSLRNSVGGTNTLDRQVARHKLVGGAAQIGAEAALPMAILPGGEEAPEPSKMPALTPNAPNVYSQPQAFKGASVKTRLKPIDFTKIPSYHR